MYSQISKEISKLNTCFQNTFEPMSEVINGVTLKYPFSFYPESNSQFNQVHYFFPIKSLILEQVLIPHFP